MTLAQTLADGWAFAGAPPGSRRPPRGPWRPARVPGAVHLDLLAQGLIPDPLKAGAAEASAWVEARDWWYRCRFRAVAGLAGAPGLRLEAGGLDTWCTLWLNGRRLGRAQTMFAGHSFPLGRALESGENELLLRFESPGTALAALERRHGRLAGLGDPRRMHGRKAACSFGWDFAPRLPGCGVFRPVRLVAPGDRTVADAWVRTLEASPALARGVFEAVVESRAGGEAVVEFTLGPWTRVLRRRLVPGPNRVGSRWSLRRPPLWWPNGLGAPALVGASARVRGGEGLDFEAGLRTVELRRAPDRAGASFGFVVNSRSIFAKGANVVPPDPFPARVDAKMGPLLDDAAAAGYNFLRVWGGGDFGGEAFYSGCDRRGLLVWQDFPFACSEAPEHPAFLALVEREARAVLPRLRRHPSLALLCGGNENHMARHDGWFRGRESPRWGRALYHRLLPALCRRLAPGVPYWPGSPYGGRDPNSEGRGDRHHWRVWGQWADPEAYLADRGRFLSEFGLASLPNPAALSEAAGGGGLQGRSLAAHDRDAQVNGGGLARLAFYIHRNLPWAPGLEAFRYLSQVFQARGLALGIEHWRRLKPHTAGVLVWQHNDCWPGPSWSLIDSRGEPKLAYFAVRRAFDGALLSAVEGGGGADPGRPPGARNCEVWLTLDGPAPASGVLRVERWNVRGREAVVARARVRAPGGGSRRLWRASRAEAGISEPGRQVLVARYDDDAGWARRCLLLFARPVAMDLPPARVGIGVRRMAGAWEVTLNSPVLALSAEVRAPLPGRFDDNGVDLLPGERRRLIFRPAAAAARGRWEVATLNAMAGSRVASGPPPSP